VNETTAVPDAGLPPIERDTLATLSPPSERRDALAGVPEGLGEARRALGGSASSCGPRRGEAVPSPDADYFTRSETT